MAIKVNQSAFVDSATETISVSTMFAVTAATSDPTYVVLTALDRNEYTAGATGATGSFTGNGHTASFSSIGGDGRGAGIVFTYQAATGRYYSSTYGYLDQLTYTTSASSGDVTNLSLFATSNLSQATADAANPTAMMQLDPAGYIGSVTAVTQPGFTGAVPTQATPQSIAAVAERFVGDAWNMNGCWVLASTIAADAGAALPVQSTAVGLPGQANGEWIVAFDGPAGQSGNWQSLLTAGEMVVFETAGGTGHVTTCVSGSGGTAMVVDNATYENASGQITNAAKDGSNADIVIAAPHLASQEFAGVAARSVVIYELDTPILTDLVATDGTTVKAVQPLAGLFSAKDPANRAIVSYQVYDNSAAGVFTVSGVNESAHTATTALTVGSLASVNYVAAATAGSDTIDIRAFNGTDWGDWSTLAVTVAAPSPPVVSTPTAAQVWAGGQHVSLTLAANTFKDPSGETLTLAATQSNGQALPSWLSFNPATDSFSGTAPVTAQTLGLQVTATDTSGLSVADVFQVSVTAPGLTLAHQTAAQSVVDGTAFSIALPADTFTDAAGQHLSYVAAQIGGANVGSWLRFNATTDTLYGVAPKGASGTAQIAITATDGNHQSATDTFSLSYAPAAAGHAVASIEMVPWGWWW